MGIYHEYTEGIIYVKELLCTFKSCYAVSFHAVRCNSETVVFNCTENAPSQNFIYYVELLGHFS